MTMTLTTLLIAQSSRLGGRRDLHAERSTSTATTSLNYIAQYHTPSLTLLASLSRVPQGLTKISFCIVMENVHEVEEVAGQYQTGLF